MENKLTKIKTSCVHLIIEYEDTHNHKIIKLKDLQNVLNKMGHFWLILHDADYEIDLTKKRNHYHVVLSIKSPRQLKWYIDSLTELLNIKSNMISINVASDLLQNIRYLVHADDKDKTQYSWNCVTSNDYGTLIEANNYIINVTTSMLLQFINQCKTKHELCHVLGLSNFRKYLNVINVLWVEKDIEKSFLHDQNENFNEEVPF